jgi:hypothetical protein
MNPRKQRKGMVKESASIGKHEDSLQRKREKRKRKRDIVFVGVKERETDRQSCFSF